MDFAAGTVHLYDSKNKEGRTFPFNVIPRLQEILEAQPRDGDLVFPVHYRKALNAWKKESGILLHDLRRSAVRNLERAGVPRSIAMKLTGHKTDLIYRRYDIVCEADLREGAQKLAEYFGPQLGPQRLQIMR